MFTGLIDHCGIVKILKKKRESYALSIETDFNDLQIGESISVDGACLTVTEFNNRIFSCEISPETKKLTLVDDYKIGRLVNLERALCINERLAGHFVMGHIDCTAPILEKNVIDNYFEILIGITKKDFLIQKGSIAVNGVSLTINEILKNGCKLMLIPHTLVKTNLSHLSTGDRVNIEFDWLAKLVASQIKKMHILE